MHLGLNRLDRDETLGGDNRRQEDDSVLPAGSMSITANAPLLSLSNVFQRLEFGRHSNSSQSLPEVGTLDVSSRPRTPDLYGLEKPVFKSQEAVVHADHLSGPSSPSTPGKLGSSLSSGHLVATSPRKSLVATLFGQFQGDLPQSRPVSIKTQRIESQAIVHSRSEDEGALEGIRGPSTPPPIMPLVSPKGKRVPVGMEGHNNDVPKRSPRTRGTADRKTFAELGHGLVNNGEGGAGGTGQGGAGGPLMRHGSGDFKRSARSDAEDMLGGGASKLRRLPSAGLVLDSYSSHADEQQDWCLRVVPGELASWKRLTSISSNSSCSSISSCSSSSSSGREPEAVAETEPANSAAVKSEDAASVPSPHRDPKPALISQKSSCPAPVPAAAAASTAGAGAGAGAGQPAYEPVSCKVAAQTCAGQKGGAKKVNQDAYFFMRTENKSCLLFGVFDGHGPNGEEVSKFCKEKMPVSIQQQPQLLGTPEAALRDAFYDIDAALECEAEVSVSGTTAVVAQVYQERLAVAWVGDSRAVVGRADSSGKLRGLALTEDHKPELPEERERIEAEGGRVDRVMNPSGEEVGPYRVWLGVAPILGLAMSRSLGDSLAHTVGVVSQAQTATLTLDPSDRFMIMATDGIWEFIGCDEAVEIVGASSTIETGCKKLMQVARARWRANDGGGYIDDITALVVGFTHKSVVA